MDSTDFAYYIIVLKGAIGRFDYMGMYCHDGRGAIMRLHGPDKLPDELGDEDIDKFFKYNSGSKIFEELPNKTFSLTVDAVSIKKKRV